MKAQLPSARSVVKLLLCVPLFLHLHWVIAPVPQLKKANPTAVSVQSGKTYEQEFDFETTRANEGKTKNTPWGCSYRAPPEILHGVMQ